MSLSKIMTPYLRRIVFGTQAHQKLHTGLKKTIQKELNKPPGPILKEIHLEAEKIKARDANFVKDPVSSAHLEFVSKILAAYTILLKEFNDKEKAIAFIKKAMMAGLNTPSMRFALNSILFSCKNNPERFRKIFSWLMKQYGTTFEWTTEQLDENSKKGFSLVITKCFYCNYFKSQGLLELTPILCQLDGIWFEMIDPDKLGYRFDKINYQTQGYGAEKCIFPIKAE